MKNRPLPVIIVSALFIIAGCVGFIYHIKDFYAPNVQLNGLILIQLTRILAIVCGVLLLFGVNWARWLAIGWLAYHIVISSLNSTSEMIAHILFLIIVSILLFIPVTSAYFKSKNKSKEVLKVE